MCYPELRYVLSGITYNHIARVSAWTGWKPQAYLASSSTSKPRRPPVDKPNKRIQSQHIQKLGSKAPQGCQKAWCPVETSGKCPHKIAAQVKHKY